MKGIILAGGSGTRLYPATLAISKQLLPIYNKPMIYYPLSTLMASGIREVLIITRPEDQAQFKNLLGDGSQWGIEIVFATQAHPNGLAEAVIIGEDFVKKDPFALILGDNLFFGSQLNPMFSTEDHKSGAVIFGYYVKDPERYGVIEFNDSGEPSRLVEKPENPKTNWAITGLYVYDEYACELAKTLKPSKRGELEITELNQLYLERDALKVEKLQFGTAWLDTGTFNSFMQAGEFIQALEERQGLLVGSPDEVAFRKGYINADQFNQQIERIGKSTYAQKLKSYLSQLR